MIRLGTNEELRRVSISLINIIWLDVKKMKCKSLLIVRFYTTIIRTIIVQFFILVNSCLLRDCDYVTQYLFIFF